MGVELIVASGDASELFELVEKALDTVAAPITLLVEGRFLTATGQWWDHRFDAIAGQTLPDAMGVVAHVQAGRFQNVVSWQTLIKSFELPAIMGLPARHLEGDRTVFVDGGGVDLCAKSSARPAQSLVATLFWGAPATWGYARTVVESKRSSRAPAKTSACKFRHKRPQTSRSVQPPEAHVDHVPLP